MIIWETIVSILTTITGFLEMAFFYTILLPLGMIPAALLQENLEQLLQEWEQLAQIIEPVLEVLYQIP